MSRTNEGDEFFYSLCFVVYIELILTRHLCFAEARKIPIHEIHLDKVLTGLDLTMEQFIDLCILLGCDYADKIKGIGPIKALGILFFYF